ALASLFSSRIDLIELDPVELLALDQLRLAGIRDLDLLQHLTNDDFDVLVVDRHALQSIDVLDLVDQIVREFLDAFDRQDVVRRRVAVVDKVATLDAVAILNGEALATWDQILGRLLRFVIRLDVDALLVLVVLTELDGARNLRKDRVILRTTCFEEFCNARQTAGDVARLRRCRRNTSQHVAGLHRRTTIDREHGIDRQQVTRITTARDLDRLALAVLDDDRGLQLGAARSCTPVDDDAVRRALHFVRLLAHRRAFDQVLEVDRTIGFRQDRTRIGVPLRDLGATLYDIAFVDEHART